MKLAGRGRRAGRGRGPAVRVGLAQLRARLAVGARRHQRIRRHLARVGPHDEFEPVREERSEHQLQLFLRGVSAFGLRDDVEACGAQPVRAADDLKILDAIRVANHEPQRHVHEVETAAGLRRHQDAAIAGRVRLDRRDLERRRLRRARRLSSGETREDRHREHALDHESSRLLDTGRINRTRRASWLRAARRGRSRARPQALRRFELQPELFLQRGKDRGAVVGWPLEASGGGAPEIASTAHGGVRGVFERQFEVAGSPVLSTTMLPTMRERLVAS